MSAVRDGNPNIMPIVMKYLRFYGGYLGTESISKGSRSSFTKMPIRVKLMR